MYLIESLGVVAHVPEVVHARHEGGTLDERVQDEEVGEQPVCG